MFVGVAGEDDAVPGVIAVGEAPVADLVGDRVVIDGVQVGGADVAEVRRVEEHSDGGAEAQCAVRDDAGPVTTADPNVTEPAGKLLADVAIGKPLPGKLLAELVSYAIRQALASDEPQVTWHGKVENVPQPPRAVARIERLEAAAKIWKLDLAKAKLARPVQGAETAEDKPGKAKGKKGGKGK